jgi:hypothetical protein
LSKEEELAVAADNGGGGGGGFGWGLVFGGLLGFLAGAYLASGPGREQVDSLRTRTIELTGGTDELRTRAKAAAARMRDPEHPIGKAIQDGISAARKRREELESTAGRNRTSSSQATPKETSK